MVRRVKRGNNCSLLEKREQWSTVVGMLKRGELWSEFSSLLKRGEWLEFSLYIYFFFFSTYSFFLVNLQLGWVKK
ncbi:hypothetical protein HanIR_Chr02g0064911 [Helianthus annuus]|nr:hypothetical protein HanIR_Chr02g0064911 [Helianthus annuus]